MTTQQKIVPLTDDALAALDATIQAHDATAGPMEIDAAVMGGLMARLAQDHDRVGFLEAELDARTAALLLEVAQRAGVGINTSTTIALLKVALETVQTLHPHGGPDVEQSTCETCGVASGTLEGLAQTEAMMASRPQVDWTDELLKVARELRTPAVAAGAPQ